MFIHALRVDVFKGIGEQSFPFLSLIFLGVFLRFHSQTASPKDAVPYSINQTAVLCKENRSGNLFRRFVGFFPPFLSDVWRSFSASGPRPPRLSPERWFLVEFDRERRRKPKKKCRIRLSLLHFAGLNCPFCPVLTFFPALLSWMGTLASFFLFVYNKNRIETHLFLQSEHKAGGTA